MIILALLVSWVVTFGWAAGRLAAQRDRSPRLWMGLGAILGPAAMIVLQESPPGRCGTCRAPVTGWSIACRSCGSDVRTRAPAGSAVPAFTPPAAPMSAVAATVSPQSSRSVRVTARREPVESDWDAPGAAVVSSAQPAQQIVAAPPSPLEGMLVSGVYVTGSIGLSVGSRYIIQFKGANLRLLGPVDRDPAFVALERPLAGMDASGDDGRLVINQIRGGRAGLVLVFMSVSGGSLKSVATEIARVARTAELVNP